jgi:hypothetical protein
MDPQKSQVGYPRRAEDWAAWVEDKSALQPKMNLVEWLFDGPILLGLESR